MASAIQQAVQAAKKRLQMRQSQEQKGSKSGSRDKGDDRGDVDMEMSSDDEANKSGSDNSSAEESGDEGDARDRLRYANSSGQSHVRRILPRGMAPAGAIAWQVSKKILLEKLRANGRPYLVIEKATFQQDRTDRHGTKASPSNEELQHLFRKYGIDRVRAFRSHSAVYSHTDPTSPNLGRLSPMRTAGTSLSMLGTLPAVLATQ